MFEKGRKVVCAAYRNEETGVVITGVRHSDALMNLKELGLSLDGPWKAGFVDQYRVFMTRQEAWKVADAAGQIRCDTARDKDYVYRKAGIGDESILMSEMLY